MSGCVFDLAWIGYCGRTDVRSGDRFCSEHTGKVCVSCGGEAVRECDQTGIQFVCCAPLCGECQHGVPERGKEGMFALGGGHVTKGEYERQMSAMFDREGGER